MPVEIDIAHVAHLARIALTDEELATRKANWKGPKETIYASGALWKYSQLVGGGRLGAVTQRGAQADKDV